MKKMGRPLGEMYRDSTGIRVPNPASIENVKTSIEMAIIAAKRYSDSVSEMPEAWVFSRKAMTKLNEAMDEISDSIRAIQIRSPQGRK